MARYKSIDTSPRFLPVDLARQLIPGTFEHAVHHLLTREIDLSAFDARFRNDETGAPAYPPAMLLQVILVAYAHGVISSRGIERLCRDHVTFIALCGDTAPHFTTIAEFVSTVGDAIAPIFAAVVAACDAQGLIGRQMFAIDGVKLPSNASKARSGTRADFARHATKLEATVQQILARHRASDQLPAEPTLSEKEHQRVTRLQRDAAQIRAWLTANPADRAGVRGGVRKSNRTDNESAKMATGKGVIQGYTGVAAVDAAHQIIVEAQAHGTGSEQELLMPIVTAITPLLTTQSLITADAGYHSERNLAQLDAAKIDALIADNDMRRRDDRFATQADHHATASPLHDKSAAPAPEPAVFEASAFTYDAGARTCVCPAGKTLNRAGRDRVLRDTIWTRFTGKRRDCASCPLRAQCIRDPASTSVRSVMFLQGKDGAVTAHADGADEGAHRPPREPRAICRTLWRGRARVRQPVLQQGPRTVYAPGAAEGRRAVETLLSRPQH